MTEITITFNPTLDRLNRAFNRVNLGNDVSDELNKIATNVVRFGKQLAPVRTGLMRSRISQTGFATSSTLRALIQTGTDYSIYVHEGTRYMRARPFLETGARFAVENIAGNISNRLERGFVDAFKSL